MASDYENLLARQAAITKELADGQTPDGQSFRQPTISVEGVTVNTDQYVQRLYDELERISNLLGKLSISNGGVPFEVHTKGLSR